MLFHDVSKKPHDPGGSDTNNSENHGNWGCRHRLRKGRSSPEPSNTGRNLRHGSEARDSQIPGSTRVSWERTQKEKKSSKNPVPKEKRADEGDDVGE